MTLDFHLGSRLSWATALSFGGSMYTGCAISRWKRESSEGSSASNEVESIEIRGEMADIGQVHTSSSLNFSNL